MSCCLSLSGDGVVDWTDVQVVPVCCTVLTTIAKGI